MRHWPIAVHSKAPQKISQMRKNHDEYMWIYICICNYMYLYMVPCSIYLFVVSFCNVQTQALQPTKVVSMDKVAPVVSLESWFLHWNSNSENPPKNFPSWGLPILRRFCRTCGKNLSHLLAFQALSQLPPQCHFTSAGARHTANQAAEL